MLLIQPSFGQQGQEAPDFGPHSLSRSRIYSAGDIESRQK
jgi:hypothetical protein